jgi:hypothetical protein
MRLLHDRADGTFVDARAAIYTCVHVNDRDVTDFYRILRANIGARAASGTVVCFYCWHFYYLSRYLTGKTYFNVFPAASINDAAVLPLRRSAKNIMLNRGYQQTSAIH